LFQELQALDGVVEVVLREISKRSKYTIGVCRLMLVIIVIFCCCN
jgi:hypothetical protein